MPGPDASSSPPHILVLWDIDHTLIETRGVGHAIYQRTFPVATGKPLQQLAEVAGRTELVIMRETLQLHDVEPTDEAVRRLAAALVQGYEDAREELATTGRVLPGAEETLAALAADPRVHQAVLSGNLRTVSRIKLEVFGLDPYLDLASSAYGDDHTERPELVAIARQRATEQTAGTFDTLHTVLIGDTPKDVEAALTAGVRVIGVASGKSDAAELQKAGAETVLPDLRDVPRTVNEIALRAKAGRDGLARHERRTARPYRQT